MYSLRLLTLLCAVSAVCLVLVTEISSEYISGLQAISLLAYTVIVRLVSAKQPRFLAFDNHPSCSTCMTVLIGAQYQSYHPCFHSNTTSTHLLARHAFRPALFASWQSKLVAAAGMDERHWWFASKLQETFHFGGYDNPTVLEDFLSDQEVVDLINNFLAPGEPCKLFFYCDEPRGEGSRTPSASRQLHAASELACDVINRGGKVCLYVLRADTSGEVEAAQMERELFCGELRHSVLSSLATLLSDAYAPLLHTQRNWGDCSDAAVTNFLQNFDKFSSALLEAATLSQTQRPLLVRPPVELQSLQQCRDVLSIETVSECDFLVGEWINSIESLLIETTDERQVVSFIDKHRNTIFAQDGKSLLKSIVRAK